MVLKYLTVLVKEIRLTIANKIFNFVFDFVMKKKNNTII